MYKLKCCRYSKFDIARRSYYLVHNAPIDVIPGEGRGGGVGGGRDFGKAFMPKGVAFDFMDLPQSVDI